MTRRIFRAIVMAALTILTIALVLSIWVSYSYFTQVQYRQLREETILAARALSLEGDSYFEGLENQVSCRMTWVDEQGNVLYDSRGDSVVMENHRLREEIQEALDSGYGQSARYSGTLFQRYLYSAQRLPDGTVLRLSTQQSSVLKLMEELFLFIALVLVMAVGLSLLLARRLSRDIVSPINCLNLDDPLSNRDYEEILPLLQRMEIQRSQLQAQAVELRQKKKEFQTVIRSLGEGLVLLGSDSTILSINPAAARLLGITPNCLGANFSVANRNPDISTITNSALAGSKQEITVTLAEGKYLASASPVKSEGQITGVVLLLFDVTEKQRSEQLRREFTANVSHELKTPLHVISGYAELMKSGLVPQENTAAFSEKIYSQTQQLIHLVNEILQLSRLDEGAADMQWTQVDLFALAQETVREFTAPAELAGVSLKLEGTHVFFQGIPQLISGILFNLTDNAIKYNRETGSVLLRIEDNSSHACLTVSDTGIGIPEEYQERIFERFYRVDKSHSAAVEGTGLGLSIVKHAAAIHNASITLDSVPGQGATITVCFPK